MPCPGLGPPSPSCAFTAYMESGFAVSAISGGWFVRTDYGHPAPFIELVASAGTTVNGTIRIVASTGSPFYFESVDLYASTTPIPYSITGTKNGATVFTLNDTVANTFGDFRTIVSSHRADAIEALSIALNDAAAPCCSNPMGLDTIVLGSVPNAPLPVPSPTPNPSVTPTRVMELSGNLAFGNVEVGSKAQSTLSIKNSGNSDMTVTGIAFTDDLGGVFTSAWTGGTISPGITHRAIIQFTPLVAQTYRGTLTVLGNQTDGANTIAVSGTGTPLPSGQHGVTTVTFGGLTADGASVTSYSESGVSVTAISGGWVGSTTFGNPAPSIQFRAPGGSAVTGEVRVSMGGTSFSLGSVDLYASTTSIPYALTGFRNSSMVFTVSGTVPNTFGAFKTLPNPNSAALIDALSIVLTNNAAPCCSNPMGLDNILLTR